MYVSSHNDTSIIRLRTLITLCLIFLAAAVFAHEEDEETDKAGPPGPIFSTLLNDFPGTRLTVVELNFKPGQSDQSSAPRRGHRHPGPVYVYVTKGSVRWAIEGKPVEILHAGDSYFEPTGVLHTLAENASTTESASVIAVLLIPDGAPLLSLD